MNHASVVRKAYRTTEPTLSGLNSATGPFTQPVNAAVLTNTKATIATAVASDCADSRVRSK